MRRIAAIFLIIFSFTLLVTGIERNKPVKEGKTVLFNFEKTKTGNLPEGFKAEATNRNKGIEVWKVVEIKNAPSGKRVLFMADPKGAHGSMYNLCWTDKVKFKNGTLTVKFKAVKGREDEGGGIAWRIKDKNNYYVARFNPLEDNFRVYYVKKGRRVMLKSAMVKLNPKKWHTMTVKVKGNHYQCFLDGKKYLKGNTEVFKDEGGVGLWTKADAVTMFDDFKINIE